VHTRRHHGGRRKGGAAGSADCVVATVCVKYIGVNTSTGAVAAVVDIK